MAPPPRLALSHHASRRLERQPSSHLPLKNRRAPRVRTRPRIERWQRAGPSSLLAVVTWGRRQRAWALEAAVAVARRPPNYRWKSERGRRERTWEPLRSELTLARSLDSPENHGRSGRPSSCSVPSRLSVEDFAPSEVKTSVRLGADAAGSSVRSARCDAKTKVLEIKPTLRDNLLEQCQSVYSNSPAHVLASQPAQT